MRYRNNIFDRNEEFILKNLCEYHFQRKGQDKSILSWKCILPSILENNIVPNKGVINTNEFSLEDCVKAYSLIHVDGICIPKKSEFHKQSEHIYRNVYWMVVDNLRGR